MDLIQRRQAAVMNQHYQRYSLDYFLDAQQRIGFTSIELWCGAQHFWLDDQHYDDVQSLLRKVQRRGLEVVSLTCPSFCFQYQYAPFSPEVADYCLSYFKKGLAVAEDLGCTVMTVNSGWGCMDRPRQESWNASCELLRQLAEEAEQRHITLALESLRQDETDLAYDLPTTRQLIEQVGHPSLVQHFQYAVRHGCQIRKKIVLRVELPQRRIVCDALHHMAAVRTVCQIQYPPERQLTAVVLIQLVKLHLH